jgi:uncharacterized membrane protein
MTKDRDYNYEAEMAGLYAGGVLGGLFVGSAADLLFFQPHSMFWYGIGCVVGAAAGFVAGAIFRKLALQDQESLEPSP